MNTDSRGNALEKYELLLFFVVSYKDTQAQSTEGNK